MLKLLYVIIVTSCVDDDCISIRPYTFERLEDCKKIEQQYLETNQYLPHDGKIRFISAICKPLENKG